MVGRKHDTQRIHPRSAIRKRATTLHHEPQSHPPTPLRALSPRSRITARTASPPRAPDPTGAQLTNGPTQPKTRGAPPPPPPLLQLHRRPPVPQPPRPPHP